MPYLDFILRFPGEEMDECDGSSSFENLVRFLAVTSMRGALLTVSKKGPKYC